MKRLLIPFVAAFGLSLGVATGVVMVRTPKAPPIVAKAVVAKPVPQTPTPEPAKPDSVSGTSSTQAATDAQPAAAQAADRGTAVAPTSATAPVLLAAAQEPRSVPTNGKPSMAPATTKQQPSATIKTQSAVTHAATAAAAAADTVVGKKLAKVFGAMQARDAARVLEQMDDGDVRTILASLSNKQQAAILGTFPTQRAATIMRATLRDSGSEQ